MLAQTQACHWSCLHQQLWTQRQLPCKVRVLYSTALCTTLTLYIGKLHHHHGLAFRQVHADRQC